MLKVNLTAHHLSIQEKIPPCPTKERGLKASWNVPVKIHSSSEVAHEQTLQTRHGGSLHFHRQTPHTQVQSTTRLFGADWYVLFTRHVNSLISAHSPVHCIDRGLLYNLKYQVVNSTQQ